MANEFSRIMTLPTLALRGVSVFPGTVMNFDVERPMSVAALNAVIGTDRTIFVVAQRDIAVDAPKARDLCEIGTVCRIGQILRVPGSGGMKVIVEGVHRARMIRITAETPCFWANVQIMNDLPYNEQDLRVTALIRRCNDLFAEYAGITGGINPEILLKSLDKTDASFVSDHIAHNVHLPAADKQELLEEADPVQRLEMLSHMIDREVQIVAIEHSIHETTAENLARNQKDYYLREQMRVI